jgi:hypothetical protein
VGQYRTEMQVSAISGQVSTSIQYRRVSEAVFKSAASFNAEVCFLYLFVNKLKLECVRAGHPNFDRQPFGLIII